jgi:type IV secretory pathway component VirB8
VSEIETKHDIKRYVLARESYNYGLLQTDYDLTMNMSCDDVFQEYNKRFDGDKALDKVLGAGTEWRVAVTSIRLPNDEPGKAVVSFERTIYHGLKKDPDVVPGRFEATLSYTNNPSMMAKESVWIDNPRGFKACAYRVDDVLSTGRAAK